MFHSFTFVAKNILLATLAFQLVSYATAGVLERENKKETANFFLANNDDWVRKRVDENPTSGFYMSVAQPVNPIQFQSYNPRPSPIFSPKTINFDRVLSDQAAGRLRQRRLTADSARLYGEYSRLQQENQMVFEAIKELLRQEIAVDGARKKVSRTLQRLNQFQPPTVEMMRALKVQETALDLARRRKIRAMALLSEVAPEDAQELLQLINIVVESRAEEFHEDQVLENLLLGSGKNRIGALQRLHQYPPGAMQEFLVRPRRNKISLLQRLNQNRPDSLQELFQQRPMLANTIPQQLKQVYGSENTYPLTSYPYAAQHLEKEEEQGIYYEYLHNTQHEPYEQTITDDRWFENDPWLTDFFDEFNKAPETQQIYNEAEQDWQLGYPQSSYEGYPPHHPYEAAVPPQYYGKGSYGSSPAYIVRPA